MGIIKDYKNLNEEEKNKAYEYIKEKDKSIISIDNIEEVYNSKVYNYGEGVLFYFSDNQIVSSICAVLEVARKLESSYIHRLYIENIDNRINVMKEMIEKSISIGKSHGAVNIRLGINENHISSDELEKLNLKIQYRSLTMILKDKSKKEKILNLEKLSEYNKLKYIEIYNDSFSDMPHGTVIDIQTVNKNIEKSNKDNSDYCIVLDEFYNYIGIMEITIENNNGIFDIGLKKEYRGKGYGKKILETAIQFLVDREVIDISLIVIEENKRAYDMYVKRGFEISNVIGHWIILS